MRNILVGTLLLSATLVAVAIAEESGDEAGGAIGADSIFTRDPNIPDGLRDDSPVGTALAEALQSKNATRIELTIKCGQYVLALTVFDDGSFKATDMQNELVDQAELASARAALPMLRVIDTGCPED